MRRVNDLYLTQIKKGGLSSSPPSILNYISYISYLISDILFIFTNDCPPFT